MFCFGYNAAYTSTLRPNPLCIDERGTNSNVHH